MKEALLSFAVFFGGAYIVGCLIGRNEAKKQSKPAPPRFRDRPAEEWDFMDGYSCEPLWSAK